MVGWLSSKAAVKSQMQTGRVERLSTPTICSRVGSASAFSTSTDASTLAGGTVIEGGQQTPFTRSGRVAFIVDSLAVPLTVVYGFATIPSTTINSLRGEHGHDSRIGSGQIRGNGDPVEPERRLLRCQLLWWIRRGERANWRGSVFGSRDCRARAIVGSQPGLWKPDRAGPVASRRGGPRPGQRSGPGRAS